MAGIAVTGVILSALVREKKPKAKVFWLKMDITTGSIQKESADLKFGGFKFFETRRFYEQIVKELAEPHQKMINYDCEKSYKCHVHNSGFRFGLVCNSFHKLIIDVCEKCYKEVGRLNHQIAVCVGSSCHLRGAYYVIEELKRLIADNGMSDTVELKACFCLGECQEGVSVQVDEQVYHGLTRETVPDFFREYLFAK